MSYCHFKIIYRLTLLNSLKYFETGSFRTVKSHKVLNLVNQADEFELKTVIDLRTAAAKYFFIFAILSKTKQLLNVTSLVKEPTT